MSKILKTGILNWTEAISSKFSIDQLFDHANSFVFRISYMLGEYLVVEPESGEVARPPALASGKVKREDGRWLEK